MTWKRIATAVVLIPGVVALIVEGFNGNGSRGAGVGDLAGAVSNFFALGDAIGHRAYKFWTAACALAIVYVQWLQVVLRQREPGEGVLYSGPIQFVFLSSLRVEDVLFFFLIGVSVITLATKRPLVEGLPAAGYQCEWPVVRGAATKLCGAIAWAGLLGPVGILLFALVITWIGDTVAYFVGRAMGKRPFAPHLSPKRRGKARLPAWRRHCWLAGCFRRGINVPAPIVLGSQQRATWPDRRAIYWSRRSKRKRWREGFRNRFCRARRHAGPDRCAHFDHSGCLVLLDLVLLTAHVDPGALRPHKKETGTS